MGNEVVDMKVELVAQTVFQVPLSLGMKYNLGDERGTSQMPSFSDADLGDAAAEWETGNGEDLAEFAGRACYESWSRPNARTATNAGYLAHILEVGHGSVLEHATLTFYVTGVSRSLTHELVRHRAGFGFSQLSQRYVDAKDAGIVIPPEMRGSYEAEKALKDAMAYAVSTYTALAESMRAGLELQGVTGTEARKRARQAARAVMPNMTETRIVVTGNVRAWRHFVTLRGTPAADTEIRGLAVEVLRQMQEVCGNFVQDLMIVSTPDGHGGELVTVRPRDDGLIAEAVR